MSWIDERTVAHKGSAMGIDRLAEAMGYDRALGKQAAGLVHQFSRPRAYTQVFCDPRCESCVVTEGECFDPFSTSGCRAPKDPPRRNGGHRFGLEGSLGIADL